MTVKCNKMQWQLKNVGGLCPSHTCQMPDTTPVMAGEYPGNSKRAGGTHIKATVAGAEAEADGSHRKIDEGIAREGECGRPARRAKGRAGRGPGTPERVATMLATPSPICPEHRQCSNFSQYGACSSAQMALRRRGWPCMEVLPCGVVGEGQGA